MDEVDEEEQDGGEESTVRVVSKVPVYPLRNRSRPRFIPRMQEDYEDGGAYPEIRITQFPLEMGRKGRQTAVSKTVAMRVDEEGDADYAAVVKQGEKSSAVVHASYKDVMEKARDESKLQRPSEEEENATADRTRDALEKLVSGKIAAAQPRNFRGSGSAPYVTTLTSSKNTAKKTSPLLTDICPPPTEKKRRENSNTWFSPSAPVTHRTTVLTPRQETDIYQVSTHRSRIPTQLRLQSTYYSHDGGTSGPTRASQISPKER